MLVCAALGAAGAGPAAADTDMLFVTGENGVIALTVRDNGALLPVAGPFPAGVEPEAVVATPDGRHLYVTDYGEGRSDVYAFTIGVYGDLIPVAGSPFPAGDVRPRAAFVTPDGRWLYVAHPFRSSVSAFRIGEDGALSPVAGSPFRTEMFPWEMAASSDSRKLYVTHPTRDYVSSWQIGEDGALSPVPGWRYPTATGKRPMDIAVAPSGRVGEEIVFVANFDANEVGAWRNSDTDVVRGGNALPSSFWSGGEKPVALAAGANGGTEETRLYVTHPEPSAGGTVSAIRMYFFALYVNFVYASWEERAPVGPAPGVAAVSADGRRLYVADRNASTVSVFGITPGAGGMTEVAGSPFPASGGRGMAVVAPRARCAGKRATMLARGTASLKGTAGADVIVGDSAANRIDGAAGGDLICAGRGDDSVRGGSGNDRLHGQRGNDRVAGGKGRDRLDCGRGRDRARAGGRDRLRRCERAAR